MFLRVGLVAVLLSVAVASPVAALESGKTVPVSQRAMPAQPTSPLSKEEHDRLRADMEGQVERLKLNVEKFMEVQDKRVSDLSLVGNFNNGLIAFMGALVTALVVFMAFKSKEDARGAVREWLDKEAKAEMTREFDAFRLRLDQQAAATLVHVSGDFERKLERLAEERLANIDQKASPFFAKLEKGSALVDTMEEFWVTRESPRFQNESAAGSLSDTLSDPVKLRAAAGRATVVDESERTFNDWYVLALAAVKENEDITALNRFAKARVAGTSDSLLALGASYQGALAAYRTEQWEKALSQLDEMLAECMNSGIQGAEPIAARAYICKCVVLLRAQRHQEALDAVDELLSKPWTSGHGDVIKAKNVAIFKKGVALDYLLRHAEAEEAYDEFIKFNENAEDEYIKSEVAAALYNKAILRRRVKDLAGQKRILDDIVFRFGGSDAARELVAQARKERDELDEDAAANCV